MKILIIGARERDTQEDRQLVNDLVERISVEAPHSVFVGMMTHAGVGKFLKDKCLEKDGNNRYRFGMIECSVRVFADGLPKSESSQIYLARNASPFEIGDILIYLASEDRRGTCEDMVDRFLRAQRPVLILAPGEPLPANVLEQAAQVGDGVR